MSQDDFYISKGIDDPVPIFFFEPIDFILMVTFFGLGIVMKQPLVGIFLSWAVLRVSKAMRKGAKRGMMNHSLWKLGLFQDRKLFRFNALKTDYTN